MALCTQLDVEQKLQWDITSEPDATVTALIADAQAHMEAEVGRPLENATYSDEAHDGGRVSILLKNWPVTTVTTLTEDGATLTETTDFLVRANGVVIRVSGGYQTFWRTTKPQAIVVTYDGGYLSPNHDSELEHLGSICAEIVARAFRRGAENASLPAGAAGSIQSVSLDGAGSVTYATGGGDATSISGGLTQFVFITEDERRQLEKYKRLSFGFA